MAEKKRRPNPNILGTGGAAQAGKALRPRSRKIKLEEAEAIALGKKRKP